MKKTKPPPPPLPTPVKRKRARKAAQQLAEEKRYSDEDLIAIHHRIEKKDLPRIMAIAARELGHVAARPRDFYCGCIPHARTGQPVCTGARTGGSKGGHAACPLPGRLIDGEIDEDARDETRFAARIERIVHRRYSTKPQN